MAEVREQGEGGDVGGADGLFRRLLVVVDGSECGGAAFDFAHQWARTFGGEMRCVTLEESHRGRRARHDRVVSDWGAAATRVVAPGRTLAARNRSLVDGITQAAVAFGADVIVLGCDHGRLSSGHLCASVRDRLARATDLPVIVAPSGAAHHPGEDGGTEDVRRLRTRSARGSGRYAHV